MSCSSELERAGGLTGQDPKPVGEGGEDRFIYCLSCTRCWYGTCYIQAECFIFYLQFSLPIVLRGFLLSMTSRARPGQAGPGRGQPPSQRTSPAAYLQSASCWVPAMVSGITVACCTDVWVATPVSCCHAGGSKICWVPLGQACCRAQCVCSHRVLVTWPTCVSHVRKSR